MRIPVFLLRTVVGVALGGLGQATWAQAPAIIPIETFFDSQSIRQVAISPDGDKIAMVAPNQGRYAIAVMDTTNGKVSVPVRFSDENIRSVFWKGNDRLLFTSYVEGHEIPLLASADLGGKSVKRILESRRGLDDFSLFSGSLVDRYPRDDDYILIAGYTSETDGRKINPSIPSGTTASIYKVNVETGRRTQVAGLDRGIGAGYLDAECNQRLTTMSEGKQVMVMIRDRNERPWRTIKTFDSTDVRWDIRVLMADGRTAYFFDYTTEDRGQLRTLDVLTGDISESLFVPPEGEMTGLIVDPTRTRVLGIAYEGARYHIHWLDQKWKSIFQTLEAQFPQHDVSLNSMSNDQKRFIFRLSSDRDPGQYILVDMRGEGMRAQPITAVRPAIKAALMSPVEPIHYTSRDGLTIHGYLTKPGGKADKTTALLIMPHGGPFGIRDSWGYDNEIQFLANRGYAVLQVNYRGSGGYGRSFERAGYQEWGGKMQDDLTDAVKWAIAEGRADPERIGIIGASYGGYAALAGVTLTPELYKVGINYVGVSDLRIITRYDLQTDSAAIAYFSKAVGRDPALLAARSPVDHVTNIRVPTLHAYGRNDPRVRFDNWEVLEKALKKHGKTYEIIIEDKEGHGFEKEETALRYYRTVEAFLQKYMPTGGK